MRSHINLFILASATMVSGAAYAAKPYVGVAAGVAIAHKSKENGNFTAAVPAVTSGSTTVFNAITSGTALGLETKNKAGLALSGTAGLRFDNGLRVEAEVFYTQNDVSSHRNLTVGTAVIDSVDSTVLTRIATPSGTTVGTVIGNGGNGRVKRYGVFANALYDFNREGKFQPYIGAGLGFQRVDVRYIPSNVGVANSGKTRFAYQGIVGATYKISDGLELFGQYNYRASSRARVSTLPLLPATLGVESKQSIFTAGVRIPLG
jgi:opacity protein-like surface antigen